MIYLHIGAVKTGSSSLQRFMSKNSDALRRRGVWYPDVGRGTTRKHNALQIEIRRGRDPVGEQLNALLKLCKDKETAKIVISDEMLQFVAAAGVSRLADRMRGTPVRIVAYFREYAGYVTARYNQATKTGKNFADFDAYFEQIMTAPSQAELFSRWGEAFGWNNVIVRTFGSATLTNGNVVDDFLAQIGISRGEIDASEVATSNASLGWRSTELLRSIFGRIADKSRRSHGRVAIAPDIAQACRSAVSEVFSQDEPAAYLTDAQLARCDSATQHDVATLNACLPSPGMPTPTVTPKEGRNFLPSVECIPPAEVAAALAHVVATLGGSASPVKAPPIESDSVERQERRRRARSRRAKLEGTHGRRSMNGAG